MPEGDTIRRAAAKLAPVLIGQVIHAAASRWPSVAFGLDGRTVSAIEPVGKHLWISLDDGQAIRIHLGMHGKWRIGAPGTLRFSLGQVALRLELAEATVVCVGAPTVERTRDRLRPVHPVLTALGPDLLADAIDLDQVVARAAASGLPAIAEVLLDQTVACGLGNVYQSEVLFVRRLHPFDPPAMLAESDWRALYTLGRELLQRNLGPGRRITTPPGAPAPHWVYDRGGRPCLRCRASIESRVSGEGLPRRTWWCPNCQPPRPVRVP
ncbi:MAG: DNA-formamidopyrimidine glycosylase family protein [Myxococcota bacterium]